MGPGPFLPEERIYLNELYDIKNIDTYLNSKQQIEKILKETKDFKISENQETYDYIKNKFQQHSVYKNSNIDIEITDGKLKIINSNVDYSKIFAKYKQSSL